MTAWARQEQFANLLHQHKGILYKVCNSYCRNRDDREDLAQEVVVQLWRSFKAFDGRCRFSTWMYRIALNVSISFYRRESVRTRNVLSESERLLDVADERAGEPGAMQALYEAIAALGELDKALVLLYLDGHSYREIGDVMGISETNVATKMSRLKQRMKENAGKPERV